MAGKTKRRFKAPVFSRLTLAWFSAFAIAAVAAGGVAYKTFAVSEKERISLPIEGLETFARAPATSQIEEEPRGGLRLSAPGLREEPAGDPTIEPDIGDILAYPEEFDLALDESEEEPFDADDVIITIAGSSRPVTEATAASLTPLDRPRPIADPDPALLRDTPFGKIPKRGADGRKAMHVYRNSFDGGDGRPQVAIIVGGLGLNKALTERAIDELPPEISLAFAPYANDLDFWTRKARAAGHEVLIELPMESYGGAVEALGAAGLLTSRTPGENLQRLDWLMSRFGGYFAATNYLGGKFAADPEALAPILRKLGEAGVGYIDDTGAARAVAPRAGASVASVDRVIPPAPDDSARRDIRQELQALKKTAEREGAALAKTYAFRVTIDEIADWAKTLDEEEIVLAPASSRLPQRYASR